MALQAMKRILKRHRSVETQAPSPSPREKYEAFAKANGRLKERVEEALSELDDLAGEPNGDGEESKKPAAAD
jgi:hypothetical protein